MKLTLFFCMWICCFGVNLAEILGKFVYRGDDQSINGKTTMSILHRPSSIGFAPNPGPIPSNEISSVLSLALGLSVNTELKWQGLQGMSLFKSPKAVMMLSIDGVPLDRNILQKNSLMSFPVKMITEDITDMYKISEGATLASHVNQLFNGNSLVRSVSFKEHIATGGFSVGKYSVTSFWSDISNSWSVIAGNGEMFNSLTNLQVLKELKQILPKGFVYDVDKQMIMVNTNNLQFNFNLENKVDFNFFAEVFYLMWQSNDILVQTRKNVEDDVPDVYQFSISTLKELEQHYGSNSKQVQGALLLLEKLIPKLIQQFVDLYGDNILIVGLDVPSSLNFLNEFKPKMVSALQLLKENEINHLKDIDNFIPELHVVDEMESTVRQSLCDAIKGSVSHYKTYFQFECADNKKERHVVSKRSLKALGIGTADVNLASRYDDVFPVIFSIWLWLVVVLFLAIYVISLSLWYMDPGRHSIIYRLTQPRIKSD